MNGSNLHTWWISEWFPSFDTERNHRGICQVIILSKVRYILVAFGCQNDWRKKWNGCYLGLHWNYHLPKLVNDDSICIFGHLFSEPNAWRCFSRDEILFPTFILVNRTLVCICFCYPLFNLKLSSKILWWFCFFKILCRQNHLDEEIYNQLLQKAKEEGYDVSKLHKTQHTNPPPEGEEGPKDTKGIWWIKSIIGK